MEARITYTCKNGTYVVDDVLGRGGFGHVYRAKSSIGEDVVVKHTLVPAGEPEERKLAIRKTFAVELDALQKVARSDNRSDMARLIDYVREVARCEMKRARKGQWKFGGTLDLALTSV